MDSSLPGPLKTEILVSLLNEPYNFNEKAFRFNLTTFGGDRYICLKAPPSDSDSDPQVGIVDMYDDFTVERRTSRKADGAMKHPSEEIMVLRGDNEGANGQFIQVFDMSTKARLGEHIFDQEICLWRFIHERTLVLVSGDTVYHWHLKGDADQPDTHPEVFMKREGQMASTDIQVINYCVDNPADPQWALLAGIYLEENRTVRGCLQLYSVEKSASQFLVGFAGCFGTLRTTVDGRKVQFFSFVEKKADAPMKLYVMDIYSPRGEGHPPPHKKIADFSYPPEFAQDFPISAHFSARQGLIMLVSKNGHCVIFDALTATHLHTERVSTDGIFLSQQDSLTGGVKLVNRKGVVMRVYVDEDNLIEHVGRKDRELAQSLSDRYCFKQSKALCQTTFTKLFQENQFKDAAMICALSKGDGAPEPNTGSAEFGPYPATTWLRTEHTLNLFRSAASAPPDIYNVMSNDASVGGLGGGSPLLQYFSTLLSVPCRLTVAESVELTSAACSHNRISLLRELIFGGRLKCCEVVGDLIAARDKSLASVVYAKAKCLSKIIGTFIDQNQVNKIYMIFSKSIGQNNPAMDIHSVFRQISSSTQCMSNLSKPDYLEMLIKFALIDSSPRLIDPLQLFALFVQNQQLSYITSVYSVLIKDLERTLSESEITLLETRVLEANVSANIQEAELLFQQKLFQRFDRTAIGRLTERHGLYKRALECFDDFDDQRRVIAKAASEGRVGDQDGQSAQGPVNTSLSQDWMNAWLAKLKDEQIFVILEDLMAAECEKVVIQFARLNHQRLGLERLSHLFENSVEGTYYFTGSVMSTCSSPEIHFKYLQAAATLNNWQECERVIRESKSYDATKVKDFLKTLISGQTAGCRASGAVIGGSTATPCESAIRCLTNLCDIHDDIADLTEFLYRENALEFLELYVTRVNPEKTAEVIGLLLNLAIPDEKILEILNAVRGSCNIQAVVEVMEARNRLPVILNWMEERLRETGWSSEETKNPVATCLNNAIAKVYVDRRDPSLKKFLETSSGYDPLVIGTYCENKDPHMAVLAFTRGQCDRELVDLTNKNGLYRIQANYLLSRENDQLWDYVLGSANDDEHRTKFLDQLMATSLSEVSQASNVLCAVKALARSDNKQALLQILERVVILKTPPPQVVAELLTKNTNLQNLLLLTCMQIEPHRAKDLIFKLDKFDAEEAAKAALAEDGMSDVALAIYEKNSMHLKALDVMLNIKHDLPSAEQYAEKAGNTQVWTAVGLYCLKMARESSEPDKVSEYIRKTMSNFTKVERCPDLAEIIEIARRANESKPLISFLQTIRRNVGVSSMSTVNVDTELAYTMAKSGDNAALDNLLAGANTVSCQKLGDSLFNDAEAATTDMNLEEATRLYTIAKLFYSKIPNLARVTTCLVRLNDYKTAFETAKKASSSRSWLEVTLASITAGDWSVAECSALHVVEHGGDYLEKVVQAYTEHNRFDDLVRILEQACKGTSNIQLLTELGAAYAQYQSSKLLDFLKRNGGSIPGSPLLNVPKLIKLCEKERLWDCCVILYLSCLEYDQALLVILGHSESCWDHSQVCEILQKVTNRDLIYKTVTQYIDEQPASLSDLLIRLSDSTTRTLDYTRLVQTLKAHPLHLAANGDLSQSPVSIVIPYLEVEQKRSSPPLINDLLNDIYLDFQDVDKLKYSTANYKNFDQAGLAKRLEESDLLVMKQLALYLYKEDRKYEHAINIAKKFYQYPEAIAIAVQSNDPEVAEKLLTYFVKHPAYFSACLQLCAKLIRPEVAIELAWTNNITAEIMPFVIHTVKSMNDRLAALEARVLDPNSNAKQNKQSMLSTPALPNASSAFTQPSYISL